MNVELMTDEQLEEALEEARSAYQMADFSDDERVRNRERINANYRMDAIRTELEKRAEAA